MPRFGRPGEVDSQLAQGVFRLPKPQGGAAVYDVVPVGPDQFAAVALQSVSDGQEDEAGVETVSSRIVRALTSEEISAADAALRASANINVVEDRLAPAGANF